MGEDLLKKMNMLQYIACIKVNRTRWLRPYIHA